MKNKIFNISKIVLSLAAIPLWFVNWYQYVATVNGDEPGTLKSLISWHNMMDYMDNTIFPYLSITLLVTSAVLNVAVLKYPKLQKRSNIIFCVAMGLYLMLAEFAPWIDLYFN